MALTKLTILNDRYVLRNKLGEPGLYDTTYLAWNLMKKETAVVVREFSPTFLMDRSEDGEELIPTSGPAERLFDYGLNCFLREADATTLIQHPNVIHQQTYFRENNTAYSVSDYHPGATLSAVLQGQDGKLPEKAAFAIIVPLLDGLIAGHRKGLIHGRLSPDQVFLTKSGRPMLLRFHVTQILLARRCGRVSDIAIPGFTPPELMRTDGKKGPWSDVYASAATLYSIITGKRPVPAMKRYDNDPFPDVLHLESGISKGLKKVLNRAMNMDWNDRPQTIQELKQEILEQLPAASRPYTPAVELSDVKEKDVRLQPEEIKAQSAAEDIATLSREALAKSALPKISTEPPIVPLSLEDIDSERAGQWLPKVKPRETSGDGILFKKAPSVETNPLGPLSSEVAYLTPSNEGMSVTAHEVGQDAAGTSFQQVVTSATANRTRKMSIAAIVACLMFIAIAGILNGFNPDFGQDLPGPAQAEPVASEPIVITPAPAPPPGYMALLAARADSLKMIAQSLSLEDSLQRRLWIYAETQAVYKRMLREEPSDSLALSELHQLDALIASLKTDNLPAADDEAETDITLSKDAQASSALIKQGDSLMAVRNYAEAREQFEAALELAPEDEYVISMLAEIDDEIKRTALQRDFRKHIRDGERFLEQESLLEAKLSFAKALELVPNSRAAEVRLSNVNALIKEQEDGNQQFLALVKQGDDLFVQQSFSAALITYESAQLLRPDDLIVEGKIKAVKNSLKDLENLVRQRNSQLDIYKQKADSLFIAGNLDEALSNYRIAEALDPGDSEAKSRIEEIIAKKYEEENRGIDAEGIYMIAEKPPEMINKSALIDKIRYPADARRQGIEGMVVVKMLVDEQGNASRMEILKGIGYGCDREAMRVLEKAQFVPATVGGKPVKAWHTHPIKFKIIK